MKRFLSLLPLLASCAPYEYYEEANAGRYHTPTASYGHEQSVLQAQVDACEQEIGRLQARVHSMESIFADARGEGAAASEEARGQYELRLTALEDSIRRLQSNLDDVVSFSNEGAKKLSEALSHIANLDSETSRDIKNLENALRSITKAVQTTDTKSTPKSSVSASGDKRYTVAPGDTLGKIARQYDTTVESLMQLNNLKRDDYIVVGQELVLPSA